MLTHDRFNAYMVLIFSDLNKTRTYKSQVKLVHTMKLKYLLVLIIWMFFSKTNTHKIITLKKTDDEKFLFEIEDKTYIYVGEKLISFEKNDTRLIFFPENGFNDVIFPYAYGENNIYSMLHRKYSPIQENRTSTEKKTSISLHIEKIKN